MTALILAKMTASVTELKQKPMAIVAAGGGAAVAILHYHKPVFYCVPAKTYEAMLQRLGDVKLNAASDSRAAMGEPRRRTKAVRKRKAPAKR